MISESNKLFFKKAYIYSDDEAFKKSYESSKYSAITSVSYEKLGEDFLSQTKKENLKIKEKQITCIDLKLDEETIFAKFSDTAQKHVKRALKNPDLTFDHIEHPTGEHYAVYKQFEYSQGRVPMTKQEFVTYRLFAASYKGEHISGISLVESKPNVRTITIYSKRMAVEDKEIYKIIAQSSRTLVWKISLWTKENGFTRFDLGSINTTDEKKAGITDFKLSFGGDVIPEYTYMYRSNTYIFFEKFVSIKLLLKKLLRK